MPDDLTTSASLIDILRQSVGPEGITDDLATRSLFSQDIWSKGETAAFVVRPSSVEDLSRAAAACHRHRIALNPRGAGMSYTNGYTPDRAGVGIIDFSRLDRIIEINTRDMYVTAEAGVTWKQLHDALAPHGVRTPFWGPLSGLTSTLGGGLSQNNAFFGAGTYGPASDSVTCLAVVLADGTLVRTGTAGMRGAKPFWRHYGPDLTGLFLGDAGALGYKAQVTFRLIPAPEHEDWASFEFASGEACASAAADIARTGAACEVFAFDPQLTRVRMKRASLLSDVRALGNVIMGQGSLLKGLVEGAKVAAAGRTFLDDAAWSLHVTVEGRSKAGVAEDIQRLRSICAAHAGQETENSIPKIIRSNPFGPLNNMLGPTGERWVPVHGIVAMSQGARALAEIEDYFATLRPRLEAGGVETGYLLTTLSTNGFLIEPVFLWPEEIFAIHEASVDADLLRKMNRFAANPEVTALVKEARQGVIDIFSRHGAAHFQIGRAYPYAAQCSPETLCLLQAIKAAVDPDGLVNPGALGLE
jgi:D-lactate dehydrogenase (cytochrome)